MGISIVISQSISKEDYRKVADKILEKSEILMQNAYDYTNLFEVVDSSINNSSYISDYVYNNQKVIDAMVISYQLIIYFW